MFELVSGQLPLAFALGADGTLSGTPTEFSEGSYTFTVEASNAFTVEASNAFGSDQATATITVVDQTTTEEPSPETGVQRVRAKVCTKGANDRRECATRTLFGNFPQLKGRAAASLVRGPVTYATGHATARYRELTLRRRCEPPLDDQTGLMESEPRCEVPFGRYTLVLRRNHRSTLVPVTLTLH
jgi:hypothetical protein